MPEYDSLKDAYAVVGNTTYHYWKHGGYNAVFLSEDKQTVLKASMTLLADPEKILPPLETPDYAVSRWNTLMPPTLRTAAVHQATIFFSTNNHVTLSVSTCPFVTHHGGNLTEKEIKQFVAALFLGDPSNGIIGGAFLADACALCDGVIGNIKRLEDGRLVCIDYDQVFYLSKAKGLNRKGSENSLESWYAKTSNDQDTVPKKEVYRKWYLEEFINKTNSSSLLKNTVLFLAAVAYWIEQKELSPYSPTLNDLLDKKNAPLVKEYADCFFNSNTFSDDDVTRPVNNEKEEALRKIENEIRAAIQAANQSKDRLFSDLLFNRQWNDELESVLTYLNDVNTLKDIYLFGFNRFKILPYTEDVLKRLIDVHEGITRIAQPRIL